MQGVGGSSEPGRHGHYSIRATIPDLQLFTFPFHFPFALNCTSLEIGTESLPVGLSSLRDGYHASVDSARGPSAAHIVSKCLNQI